MEEKKIKIKKVPPIKAEPTAEDVAELLERIYPNDLKDLYFFIVGVLTARGYEFVDWGFVFIAEFKVVFN